MPRGIPPLPPNDALYAFLTYRNYVDATLRIIRDRFGKDLDRVHGEVTSQPRFQKLLRANADVPEVRRHLHSAWSTELIMSALPRTSLGAVIRYANV